jgi:hypothetical protein
MKYPATYGAVMRPLIVSELDERTQKLMAERSDIRRWIELNDVVRRAEKISSYLDWTSEQTAAYELGWETFSRARGYTEDEIATFKSFHELHQILCEEDLDLLWELEFALDAVRSTPELDAINEDLRLRSSLE